MTITEDAFLARFAELLREELEQSAADLTMQTQQLDVESWDSLAHIRLILGVERLFGVQFEVTEIEEITSVRTFYDATARHLR